jgi:hypothetical protein
MCLKITTQFVGSILLALLMILFIFCLLFDSITIIRHHLIEKIEFTAHIKPRLLRGFVMNWQLYTGGWNPPPKA